MSNQIIFKLELEVLQAAVLRAGLACLVNDLDEKLSEAVAANSPDISGLKETLQLALSLHESFSDMLAYATDMAKAKELSEAPSPSSYSH